MNKNEWQPIETAPKDGVSEILVYEPPSEYSAGGISLVVWRSYEIKYPGFEPEWAWCKPDSDQDEQGGCATIDNPTHWMPLPDIPRS